MKQTDNYADNQRGNKKNSKTKVVFKDTITTLKKNAL
jgi:hypothetical protein